MQGINVEAFAWPLVVLIIVLTFFFIFRPQIAGFISRVQKISRTEIQALSTAEPQSPASPQSSVDKLMRSLDNRFLAETETAIKQDLDRATAELKNPVEAMPYLIRQLALTQNALRFEWLYRLIWGTQISILDRLNSSPNGETAEELKLFYDTASRIYPQLFQTYPFEKYLQFLEDSGAIVKEGAVFKIAVFGREFLTYLASAGLSRNKPF